MNAELHDVEIGTRLEKIEMAIGQENQARGVLQEANVAYSERYIIATNDMEIETISLNVGELATAGLLYLMAIFRIRLISVLPFQKVKFLNIKRNDREYEIYLRKSRIFRKIVSIKQLTKYADITTAFPDYQPEDAVYEIKVIPTDRAKVNNILVNSSITLK